MPALKRLTADRLKTIVRELAGKGTATWPLVAQRTGHPTAAVRALGEANGILLAASAPNQAGRKTIGGPEPLRADDVLTGVLMPGDDNWYPPIKLNGPPRKVAWEAFQLLQKLRKSGDDDGPPKKALADLWGMVGFLVRNYATSEAELTELYATLDAKDGKIVRLQQEIGRLNGAIGEHVRTAEQHAREDAQREALWCRRLDEEHHLAEGGIRAAETRARQRDDERLELAQNLSAERTTHEETRRTLASEELRADRMVSALARASAGERISVATATPLSSAEAAAKHFRRSVLLTPEEREEHWNAVVALVLGPKLGGRTQA